MRRISVTFTLDELKSAVSMIDNQIFRMKFIDSKMPGNVPSPEALRIAQSTSQVLQDALQTARNAGAVEEEPKGAVRKSAV